MNNELLILLVIGWVIIAATFLVNSVINLLIELFNPKLHVRLGITFRTIHVNNVLETVEIPGDRKVKKELGRFIFDGEKIYIYQRIFNPFFSHYARSIFSLRILGLLGENRITLKIKFSLVNLIQLTLNLIVLFSTFLLVFMSDIDLIYVYVFSFFILGIISITIIQSYFSMTDNLKQLIKELEQILEQKKTTHNIA